MLIVLVSLELDRQSGADTKGRFVDVAVVDFAVADDATGVGRVIAARGTSQVTIVVLI